MYTLILGGFFLLGIILLLLNLEKIPIKEGLLIFLFSSYIAVILGTMVVEMNLLTYPVKLTSSRHFQSSLLFEMLLLPAICLCFYRTTFHSRISQILIQAAIYSVVLTLVETFFERYTAFIHYLTWTWMHTLISVFLFLILVRMVTGVINRKT